MRFMSADAVFVDTNVLLYARDRTEPEKHRRAADWLARLWRSGAGRTGVQVLNEYYVNVTRKLSRPMEPAAAREDVEDLMAWRPAAVSNGLVLRAFEVEDRFGYGWWDSLVIAAALEQNCGWLLTEDLQHGQSVWGLQIVDPFRTEPAAILGR
jgi:predicted nucleic acid-binding protein